MDKLPLRFLTQEDAEIFGTLNVSLGKLARAGLPVKEGLETEIKNLKASGSAYYDPFAEDVLIDIKSGKPLPRDLKKIVELVNLANKKLFIPHVYEWIFDGEIKLTGLLPYTPVISESVLLRSDLEYSRSDLVKTKSAVKVFLDISSGFAIEKEIDGVYISSAGSFDELVFKIVEAANTFSNSSVLVRLADDFEEIDALDFVRHKKNLTNVHVVISSVRSSNELLQAKRALAAKKLAGKNSLELWLELAIPENIINLEEYLMKGLDGVVLNLDQLIAHLNGFDLKDQQFASYKKEVKGIFKFLEDGIKILHKTEHKFLAFGSISLYPEVLDFLVERGVYGIVVERYDAHSMVDLLHLAEKRMILRRSI